MFGFADSLIVIVSIELAEVPPDGVTGFGEKDAFTEEGFPEIDKVTPELNPLSDVTATVELAVVPCCIVRELGDVDIEKSGRGGGGVGGGLG